MSNNEKDYNNLSEGQKNQSGKLVKKGNVNTVQNLKPIVPENPPPPPPSSSKETDSTDKSE